MRILFMTFIIVSISSCAHEGLKTKINQDNVKPGSKLKARGKELILYRGSLNVGDNFIQKTKATGVGFSFHNKVTIINIVPSIDTKVCEEQTHILGDSKNIFSTVDRVTISRDLPMAQARFAKESKLNNIRFFSDYKFGAFGKRSGLLIHGKELLARAVIVLDKKGVIRYLQVVSELTELPDMNLAIQKANELAL